MIRKKGQATFSHIILPILGKPQPKEGEAWIVGKVIDKDTKKPIPEALVIAIEVENDTPTDRIHYEKTNSLGNYLIDRIKLNKKYWLILSSTKGFRL